MIKIKFKKKLSEALLPYSKSAQQQISSLVKDARKQNKEIDEILQIPVKDIINPSSNIMLGLPFLFYGNFKKGSLPSKEIKKNWDSKTKKFNDIFIQNILSDSFDFVLQTVIKNAPKKLAAHGFSKKENKNIPIIQFYLPNIKTDDSLPNLARHEMQHMSQVLNTLCIKYAESLKQTNDPSKVKMLDMKTQEKFGLGADKKGTTEKGLDSKPLASLERDQEYETYLSDLVHSFYNRLITKHTNSLKQDLNNLGAHATAVKYLKLLFNEWRLKPEYDGMNKILTVIFKVRPKEIGKDMLNSLTTFLEEYQQGNK